EPREERPIALALDEAEGRVAERRRDREHRQRAAVVAEAHDVRDHGAAALVEQLEGLLDVLDLEDDRAHALGVLAQPAPGAPAFTDGLADDHGDATGLEHGRLLPPFGLELRRRHADLGEVELVEEEAAHALQILDVIEQRLDLANSEGLQLGHYFAPAA